MNEELITTITTPADHLFGCMTDIDLLFWIKYGISTFALFFIMFVVLPWIGKLIGR